MAPSLSESLFYHICLPAFLPGNSNQDQNVEAELFTLFGNAGMDPFIQVNFEKFSFPRSKAN